MSIEELKAKVFISCGQTRNSGEVEIAHKIKDRLMDLGYDPYIAIEEQTLQGVKENIFRQLETSEYFIFIDFKRERLMIDNNCLNYFMNPAVRRGSLFTNQELALASYLDIPLLAFQEGGVKPEDGIMRFLQGNATPFKNRDSLPSIISSKVQELWNPHWKNQLVMEIPRVPFRDVPDITTDRVKRYFHIQVRNLHLRKPAINCSVYLEKVFVPLKNNEISIETTGVKWRGSTSPNTAIAPTAHRKFNAFWIYHNVSLEHVSFEGCMDVSNIFEDMPTPIGFKDLELTYLVISENFRPIRKTFRLQMGDKIEELGFYTS